MNCKEAIDVLYRFIDEDVEGISCEEIEVHLKMCRHCWQRFEFERQLKARFKKSCTETPCSEALRRRIRDVLDKF